MRSTVPQTRGRIQYHVGRQCLQQQRTRHCIRIPEKHREPLHAVHAHCRTHRPRPGQSPLYRRQPLQQSDRRHGGKCQCYRLGQFSMPHFRHLGKKRCGHLFRQLFRQHLSRIRRTTPQSLFHGPLLRLFFSR